MIGTVIRLVIGTVIRLVIVSDDYIIQKLTGGEWV